MFRAFLTCLALIFISPCNIVFAQEPNIQQLKQIEMFSDKSIVPESTQEIDSAAVSGPTIYVDDVSGNLATINLGTYAVHFIGNAGVQLTDIAFHPKTHTLYGVSFSSFYSINKTTGHATFIGYLGVSDVNALVFNSLGKAFSAGFSSNELYTINVSTGKVSVVGRMGSYVSGGDLTFYNDQLVLTGVKRCCTTTTPYSLVALNENTGAVVGTPVPINSKDVWGIVSTGKNELFGLGITAPGTTPALYKFEPSNPAGKRDILLKNLKSSGLGQIWGAAYDGNYQP